MKWCLPERLPEASQHMVHQADGLCAWEVAQRAVLCGSAPFPMLPTGEAYDLRPPLSASPSRLASVRGPGVSRVRSCASSVVHPFSKEAVFPLEFRRCDPSFPASSPSAIPLVSRCAPSSPAMLSVWQPGQILCLHNATSKALPHQPPYL